MNGHVNFEDGWRILEEGITKCSKILEDDTCARLTVDEYMKYYDCAYNMAAQRYHYCQEMYDSYKSTLTECVRAKVLPQLMCKHNECFFRELVKLWSNYCLMVKWTTGFLSYLDRCFVHQRKIPTLGIAAATSFFSPVFAYFNREITAALLTLINQERQGRKIEMDLLMDVMCGICRSEVNALMRNAVLQDTYTYYSMRSSEWILEYSLSDYLAKVQESINKETERLSHYLCMSDGDSRQLCLQVVSAPMMQTYERYARENQIGGQLLLQTYKTVEEELLDRCRGLTLGSGSDNGSFNYRG